MPEPDPLSVLADFPRDGTIVVEKARDFAEALATRGYHVVLVGKPSERIPWVPNAQTLNDLWAKISCRNQNAACFGTPELCELTKRMCERSQVNGNTSAYRARHWTRNFIRNLPTLLGPTAMQATLTERVPAFIVGAGSSLDRNHHLLTEASRRGVVIAVNGACRLPGVDVALTVESNDLRFKLGPLDHVGLRAFGMVSDPAVMAHGKAPLLPIYAGELSTLLEPLIGEPRLACSAHGGTAAMALAERWGCDPIVLVGHDFALGERVYPECLGLGENKVFRDGDAIRYDWADELKAQPRTNPLHDEDMAVQVPSIDGGTVWSSHTLAGTRAWFASAARGLGETTRLINASEWGATIEGWEAASLAEVISGMSPLAYEIRAGTGVSADVLAAWVRDNIDGCAMVRHACERVLESVDPGLATLASAARFAPLAEAWCLSPTRDVMLQRQTEAIRGPYYEYRRAESDARELATVLLAELPGLVSELEEACSSITRCRPEQ